MTVSSVLTSLILSTVLVQTALATTLQEWQYSNQPPFKAGFVKLGGLQNERSDTML